MISFFIFLARHFLFIVFFLSFLLFLLSVGVAQFCLQVAEALESTEGNPELRTQLVLHLLHIVFKQVPSVTITKK